MQREQARQLRFDLSENKVWAELPKKAREACVQLLAQLLEIVAVGDDRNAGGSDHE